MKHKFIVLLIVYCCIFFIGQQGTGYPPDQNQDEEVQQTVKTNSSPAEDVLENEMKIALLKKDIELLKTIYFAFILFLLGMLVTVFITYIVSKKKSVTKNDLAEYLLKKEFEEMINASLISNGLPVDGIVKGNEEINNRNFKVAEIYFKQELFQKPEQANAWVGLAQTYSGLERYKEALNSIRTAIKQDLKNPQFNKLGQISIIQAEILIKLGLFEEAKNVLENDVLVKNPNFLKAKRLLKECEKELSQKKKPKGKKE